jgi:hypothetical protein
MKRAFPLALALMLTLSLAACGGGNDTAGNNSGSTPTPPAASASPASTPPSGTPEAAPNDDVEAEPLSEAEIVGATVENTVLVGRYIGDTAMFGAARQYVVMEYFNEDGTIDEMWGTSKMLFFYDDDASYDAGFAEASEGGAGYIKEENKASLYFATTGGISNGGDWASFGELAELIDTKSQRNPEYSQYELIR